MPQIAEFLLAIGGLLLLGLATDFLGKQTFLPRVTLLLLFGVVVGDDVLGLIPASLSDNFEIISNVALLMIGFLIGGKLNIAALRASGGQLIGISLAAALGTCLLVGMILLAIGASTELAVTLACIAAATAPAATMETVLESAADNPFSRLLLAVVAIDDAWALILLSFGLAFIAIAGGTGNGGDYLLHAIRDIFGAIALGFAIGLPAAALTGRISRGRPMLTEALGLVFLCGGAAFWLDVSFLIAAMTMGAMISNLARHHDYPFHEIENIERPFMVVFFILAGAMLELGAVSELGLIGLAYLLLRTTGKITGAWLGARLSGADRLTSRWIGVALLPQAGVAIGMALLAANEFPEQRQAILTVVIGATVFFELLGPVCTRLALAKVGGTGR